MRQLAVFLYFSLTGSLYFTHFTNSLEVTKTSLYSQFVKKALERLPKIIRKYVSVRTKAIERLNRPEVERTAIKTACSNLTKKNIYEFF